MTRKLVQKPNPGSNPTAESLVYRDFVPEDPTATTSELPEGHRQAAPWRTLLEHNPSLPLALHTVPAAHGYAFKVKKGQHFRIIDLHGKQVCDFMAWKSPYLVLSVENGVVARPKVLDQHDSPQFDKRPQSVHFSTSYTRYRLKSLACPEVGESLYTNTDEPMFTLVADTCRTHDLLFMACNPGFYAQQQCEHQAQLTPDHDNPLLSPRDAAPHRSCTTNMAEAMSKYGMQHYSEVHDPFNIFQNTPYYTIKGKLNTSRAKDYVELRAEMDAVVAVSSCPYTGDGFNGGEVTDIGILIEG